ncbi:MAG: hypothetical protein M3280_11270, partial [Actinomycetota bacterium]|nr:hypothetical protein [Actinomycetota bacterium]
MTSRSTRHIARATVVFLLSGIFVFGIHQTASAAPFQRALKLDGSNDYASVADNTSLDLGDADGEDFTVETFFYVSNSNKAENENDILFHKGSAFRANVIFRSSSTDSVVFSVPTVFSYGFNTNISEGWHHAAFVYDNGSSDRFAMFFDGAESASFTGISFSPGLSNNGSPFEVGALGGASAWDDWVDEFRVSDTVRYSGSYTVPTAPFSSDANTRALWHFEDACSTSLTDSSGNGNTLTALNGASVGLPDAAAPTLAFDSASASVNESDGSATITVSRSGDSIPVVGVSYARTGGTATPTDDFSVGGTGTLAFACGDTSETFNVSLVDDSEEEPAETIELTLSDPTGGASLGSPTASTLTISANDSDSTPPTDPSVSSSSHSTSTWSTDPTVDVTWSGATDAASGVDGFSYLWDTSATTLPD